MNHTVRRKHLNNFFIQKESTRTVCVHEHNKYEQ